MKNTTQRDENPYPYSDSNKRYQTYDYYLKHRFGEKCAKISLDAGFSCPNIDEKGRGGCIYCSGGSSGAMCGGSLREQYDAGVSAVLKKWNCKKFIPYLQAHTNTFAPPEVLRKIYGEALTLPGAVMLSIATRADCLSDPVIEVLRETAEKIPLTVELGLQTSDDETARKIGRGHTFSQFCDGYSRLKNAGGDIAICVHIINGLPGENREKMLKTAEDVALLCPDMVKIHLLHIIRGTPLFTMYERKEYVPMTMDNYTEVTTSQIELLPPETVVARVTGDGKKDELVAPLWSLKKTVVTNEIDKMLYAKCTFQGAKYKYTDMFTKN